METCLKSNGIDEYGFEKYRGLLIYRNISPAFGTEFYSVANPYITFENGKNPHCHANTYHCAKQIVDCYHKLRNGRSIRGKNLIRNKALRLLNTYVKMK